MTMAIRLVQAVLVVGLARPGVASAQSMERYFTIDVDARGTGPALLAAQRPPESNARPDESSTASSPAIATSSASSD
jgi:hypothetical protein